MSLHVYLVAGEPSGDRLGAALMKALREETGGQVRFSGVGGAAMEAQGLQSLFPMSELSIMGLAEILPHIPNVLRRLRQTEADVLASGADALVTIDAQVFSANLAKRIAKRDPQIKRVQYVAPTVWAWKPHRAKKAARIYDHMMTLFPFEPAYFEKEGLAASCVGHPLTERVDALPENASEALRAELGVSPSEPLLLVAPGSRRSELARLSDPFSDAVHWLKDNFGEFTALVPVAPSVSAQVDDMVRDWPVPVQLTRFDGLDYDAAEARKFAAFGAADAALAASGTVTLEISAMGTPLVVGYRIPRLTEFIVRRMVKVNSVSLTNILSGQEAVPEFLQDDCRGEVLGEALLPLLKGGHEADRQKVAQRAAMKAMRGHSAESVLASEKRKPGPSHIAARRLLRLLDFNTQ